MPRVSNTELISGIYDASTQEKVEWQPTANPNAFAASFAGKWSVIATRSMDGRSYWVSVEDSSGERLVTIDNEEDSRVSELWERARRTALNIDEALTDFLNQLKNPTR